MTNARLELEEHLRDWNVSLLAAHISVDEPAMELVLFPDHTATELATFYQKLDFEYDAGYGSQNIFGTLWFTNGVFSDRFEYDGSENWHYQPTPDLPVR